MLVMSGGSGVGACPAQDGLPEALPALLEAPCQQGGFPPRVTAATGLGAASTKAGVRPSDLLTTVSRKEAI